MKTFIFRISVIILALSLQTVFSAELDHETTQKIKDRMQVFIPMTGQWEGSGWIRIDGNKEEFTQTEDVKFILDDTLLIVKGLGLDMTEDKNIIHEAYATLSYDFINDRYRMENYLSDGTYNNANMLFHGNGKFEWSFEVPEGIIVFIIEIADGQWNEKGYFRRFEGLEYHFFEMNLQRI